VLLARNTDFPGYWGGLASQNRGGVSNFFGYDSQGSVRILTSSLGAITDYYAYMAFGVELATGATTVNPNRYLGLFGYYRDFINWMYVRARMLDALRGRWVSRDELGFDGGDWSLYPYVGNDPLGYADPSGNVVLWPPSWSYCGPNGVTKYDPCCPAGTKCHGATQKTPVPINPIDWACKDHDCCWATVHKETGHDCVFPWDLYPGCVACNTELCDKIFARQCSHKISGCAWVRGIIISLCVSGVFQTKPPPPPPNSRCDPFNIWRPGPPLAS
jgi:RHS repeat-associated protein